MCFVIDDLAKRPRQKYAWKVVNTSEKGYVRSVCRGTDYIWQPGVKRKRSRGSTRFLSYANHGIYVYLTKEAAIAKKYWHSYIIMKVHVSPDEWLHTSILGRIATYESATPCKKQPHFDWVD